MKRLKFQEILFLSYKERKARRIRFNPCQTIIVGGNGAGKSCIMKSIYYTLGADIYKLPPKWKQANLIYLLKFSITDSETNAIHSYSIIRYGSEFILYNADKALIAQTNKTTKLSEILSTLLDFKIKLPNKKLDINYLPPAYIYLPFYIDQDNSWSHVWSSFRNLNIPNARPAITYFHTGIRPNSFYESKSEISVISKEINIINNEIRESSNLLQKLNLKYTDTKFNIDINVFQTEIKMLLFRCEELNKAQIELKKKLTDSYNKKIKIETQIEILKQNIFETTEDYDFANQLENDIYCPTCGAHYINSFKERFDIADDSAKCYDILMKLEHELNHLSQQINLHQELYNKKTKEFADIQILLKTRQKEVTLEDIIEGKAQTKVKSSLKEDIIDLQENQNKKIIRYNELIATLKLLEDKERRKSIEKKFQEYITNYSHLLNIYEMDGVKINSSINVSGSKLPRAMIVYYYSILNIINEFSTSVYCPIIIDAPNQQGLDAENLPQMINFILKFQPIESQLILGVEEFDCYKSKGEVIVIEDKEKLLKEEQYENIRDEIEFLLNKKFFFSI